MFSVSPFRASVSRTASIRSALICSEFNSTRPISPSPRFRSFATNTSSTPHRTHSFSVSPQNAPAVERVKEEVPLAPPQQEPRKSILDLTTHELSKRTIGFIGTGTLSSSIITGLATCHVPFQRMVVSPRNATRAAELKATFPSAVEIAKDNQMVVDKADVVFIAVLPSQARKVVPDLKFRPEQVVISVIASLDINSVAEMVKPVPLEHVARSVPLPPVAHQKGVTLCSAHPVAEKIFDLLGEPVVVSEESEMDALQPAACLQGAFFQLLSTASKWAIEHGVSPDVSARYTAAFFESIARDAKMRAIDSDQEPSPASFDELVAEQTPGGLNEAAVNLLIKEGVFESFEKAMDGSFSRTEAGKKYAERNEDN